jgi:hypothetical protein
MIGEPIMAMQQASDTLLLTQNVVETIYVTLLNRTVTICTYLAG